MFDKGQRIFIIIVIAFGLLFPQAAKTCDPAYVSGGYVALEDAQDGTYTDTEKGFGGDITVSVTLKDGTIADVTADGPDETEGLGSVACVKVPEAIVTSQSIDVELTAGATVSSKAIIKATTVALAKAKVDATALVAKEQEEIIKTDETLDCDVVVVGAGGAGLTAASYLAENGKNVILLEKMSYVGGNTLKASGGMNASDTKYLAEAGITDSTTENFIADTMEGGHYLNDIDLVTTMAENSSDAIDWLASIGAPLPKIAATGGTSHSYLHEPEDGSAVGKYLVAKLSDYVNSFDNVNLMLETKAEKILTDENGAAVGVTATSDTANYTINAKAVIITTGGFGSNKDMLAQYDESLRNAVSTNTPAATGDGIIMAQEIGADTVDMEQIQLHPTVYQETSELISEAMRSAGAILVNQEGNRFVNDMDTRDVVSQAELQQTGAYAYIILSQNLVDGSKKAQSYVDPEKGMAVSGETLEELAKNLGMDDEAVTNFVNTVNAWNDTCTNGTPDEFGRDNGLIALDQGPWYAIKIAPGIHHTMGGLKIDTKAEVINTSGEVIDGLYAAGEVTGGVHGGNRLGGNAVCDIIVFGRISAQSAIEYIDGE